MQYTVFSLFLEPNVIIPYKFILSLTSFTCFTQLSLRQHDSFETYETILPKKYTGTYKQVFVIQNSCRLRGHAGLALW